MRTHRISEAVLLIISITIYYYAKGILIYLILGTLKPWSSQEMVIAPLITVSTLHILKLNRACEVIRRDSVIFQSTQ